jgi:hypothetical protein
LWELYKQRARQIREAYDYVVLWYSGGSDSHNILHSWLAADCKIDEIAVTWNYKGSKTRQSHYNAEVDRVVLPDIEELKKQGYDFKFRLIDISQLSLDTVNEFGYNFVYYVNRSMSVNSAAKSLLRDKIDDYKRIIDSGKKMCFVWGIEKPCVSLLSNRYVFNFSDAIDGGSINPYVQNRFFNGWYDELFYWSPDFPLLPIKAAHVLKNFLRTCHDPNCYQDNPSYYGFNQILQQYIKVETVKTLIYPYWNNNIFCDGKSESVMMSKRDSWFFNSNLIESQKFKQSIYTTIRSIGSDWLSNKNLRIQTSQTYYLEK